MSTFYNIYGEKMANLSMLLTILLTCLPWTMILPSFLRMPLQVISVSLFIVSLLLLRRYYYLLALLILFFCSCMYFIGAWNEKMRATTFLYNSLCCWEIAIYGMMCIDGVIKYERKIFWLVVAITLVTSVTTILGLTQYPMAVRELGRELSYAGTNVKSIYRVRNIASWSQLFGMVFITGGLVYFFKENRNKFVFFTLLILELCILKAQITLGTLISIMILALMLANVKSKKIYYTIIFECSAIAVIVLFNLNYILSWFIELSRQLDLRMLSYKLRDLYNLLVEQSVTGDALARFELYTKSLKAFWEIDIRIVWIDGKPATNYIGYHSELFDLIGTLGVMGIILVLFCVSIWICKIKKIKNAYSHRFLLFMFYAFIILALLNPVFYSPQVWIGVFAVPAQLVCMKPM